MKRKFVVVVLTDISLYVLQFLIIPLVYDGVFGRNNEGIVVLCITTILFTATGMILTSKKIGGWLIGLVFYILLLALYTPKGAYGIGLVGLDLDGMHTRYDASERTLGIIVVLVLIILVQFAIWLIANLLEKVMSKANGFDSSSDV